MVRGAPETQHPLIRWIHPPHQGRSQETLDRLLVATEELLKAKRFDEITIPEIAKQAKSSVGAIYARFKDKNAILHALHQSFCEDAYATTEEGLDPARWEGESVAEIIRVVVASQVRLARPGLMFAVVERARVDIELYNRHERVRRHIARRLTALLLARRDEIRHPDPGLACDFAIRQLYAVARAELLGVGGVYGGDPMPMDRVVEELTRSLLAYLGVPDDVER